MRLRSLLVLLPIVALPACGGRVVVDHDTCEPGAWSAYASPPLAGAGAMLPFDPQALAARVGPFPDGATVSTLQIGTAPGWGCEMPAAPLVGGWSGGTVPEGDPRAHLRPDAFERVADLGGGFALDAVEVEPVEVEPGGYLWMGLELAGAACGASAQGPSEGSAWRWSLERGWTEEPGALVMGAIGCGQVVAVVDPPH